MTMVVDTEFEYFAHRTHDKPIQQQNDDNWSVMIMVGSAKHYNNNNRHHRIMAIDGSTSAITRNPITADHHGRFQRSQFCWWNLGSNLACVAFSVSQNGIYELIGEEMFFASNDLFALRMRQASIAHDPFGLY